MMTDIEAIQLIKNDIKIYPTLPEEVRDKKEVIECLIDEAKKYTLDELQSTLFDNGPTYILPEQRLTSAIDIKRVNGEMVRTERKVDIHYIETVLYKPSEKHKKYICFFDGKYVDKPEQYIPEQMLNQNISTHTELLYYSMTIRTVLSAPEEERQSIMNGTTLM